MQSIDNFERCSKLALFEFFFLTFRTFDAPLRNYEKTSLLFNKRSIFERIFRRDLILNTIKIIFRL